MLMKRKSMPDDVEPPSSSSSRHNFATTPRNSLGGNSACTNRFQLSLNRTLFTRPIVFSSCLVALAALCGCPFSESEPCQDTIPALAEVPIGVDMFASAWDIQAADDGGFVIAGRAFDEGVANSLAYIMKVDSAGVLQWATGFGGD